MLITQNKVLLIVDDDPQNRAFIVNTMLQISPEMTVLTAKHGQQALEVLTKKEVDIILLDWEMPVMNGLELLEYLQKNPVWKLIPVLMYTGAMTESGHLAQALELGAVDFLRKPADSVELAARIQSILKQKNAEKERAEALQALLLLEKSFLEKELVLAKQELNNYLLILAKKNELLLNIKKKCENSKQSKETNLQTIAQYIGQVLLQEDYWDAFLDRFNKTDQCFIQNILQENPNLSPAEIKLAVLIRLGMDNKSIANLLNITADSIKKSRYRLRKKISILEQEDSLDVYIFKL